MATREHLPNRPGWDCWACGHPWPCKPARDELAEAYTIPQLVDFMAARLDEAAKDMHTVEADELADRFMAWAW